MAFWMDPFILLALGVVIAWLAKRLAPGNPHVTLTLGLLTMVVTYVIAIGLFVNLSVFEPIWTLMGADAGTEFMLNGVVLPIAESGVTWQDLSNLELFVSIFIFTVYPIFLAIGIGLGRVLFGRNPDQGGVVGLLRP